MLLSAIGPNPAPASEGDDILIIVNLRVKAEELDLDQVKRYFLKKRYKWQDGQKILPIHAKAGSKLRNDFMSRILKMNYEEESLYWQKYLIQTGITLPPEFSNTQKAVFKLRGSIGYVYRSQYIEKVSKIVMVIPVNAGKP